MHTIVIGLRYRITLVFTVLFAVGCTTKKQVASGGGQENERKIDLSQYADIQKRPGQRPDVAVAVAISGGGMRAANFAAGALFRLQAEIVRGKDGQRSNLLREIDYISTVSGGGLAAAAYITSLLDYLDKHPNDPSAKEFKFCGPEGKSVHSRGVQNWPAALRENYESPLLGSIINPIMICTHLDRGDVLEKRLDSALLNSAEKRSVTFDKIFTKPGKVPRTPFWVTNATIWENGAIFGFTPDVLRKYDVKSYTHRLKRNYLEGENAEWQFPAAVGLKASASFPAAIPTTTLVSSDDAINPYLHLMDGGLSDNLGVITAVRLLRQDKTARKKILIVIDAYKGTSRPYSSGKCSPSAISMTLRSTMIGLDSSHLRTRDFLSLIGASDGIDWAVIDLSSSCESISKGKLPNLWTEEFFRKLWSTLGFGSPMADDPELQTGPEVFVNSFNKLLGLRTSFKISKSRQNEIFTLGAQAISVSEEFRRIMSEF